MSKVYENIIPDVEQWPITTFYNQREQFIKELNEFVFKKIVGTGRNLEDLLAKSLYLEVQRSTNNPWKVDPQDDKTYWKDLTKELNESLERSDKEEVFKSILMRLINRYNQEIVGDFKTKTFGFARKFLTNMFKGVFNKFNEGKFGRFWGTKDLLLSRLNVHGYVEEARALFEKGTVVVVPTHFSNLDSISIGYVLDHVSGLPTFAYGAGLNLFDTEIVAYYIDRLGAYKVDRRKKNPIYLECLTSMASYSLYKGLNNIFFPGGTRSRSGAIEDRLKLGLLGSAIEAQRLMIEKKSDKKVIIIPVIVGYNFVLEAKSMIDQYLRVEGKEKYMRTKDTTVSFANRLRFLKYIFTKRSSMYLAFGEPLDVMGNVLDKEGRSADKNGKAIDLKDYFRLGEDVSENSQRETVYTKLLSQKILSSYMRNNIILPSHLLSFVAFQIQQKYRKDLELFSILKLHPSELQIPLSVLKTILTDAIRLLTQWEKDGLVKLHDDLRQDIDTVINRGVETCGIYHAERVMYLKRDYLCSESIKLLYYYHNRTLGYELEREIDWSKVKEFNYLDKLSSK